MKTSWLIVFVLSTTALGILSVYQSHQNAETKTQLAAVQANLKTAEAQLAERAAAGENTTRAERKARLLQETLTQATAVSAKQSEQVSELEQSLAAAKTNSSGLNGLLKDPAMKDMIKAQQKAFMGPMIDKTYATLFEQLNLTPEKSAEVKDLLQKKMLVAADLGVSMLADSMDAEKRKELGQQIKTETDAYDQQVKEALGEDNYKTFQAYEKSLPDRMSVGQFKDQIASSGTALDPAQEQKLIQTMTDARTDFKWTTDYSNKDLGEANFAEMFNEDHLKQHAQEQATFDQQVLKSAQAFMRPEQLTAYEKFLTEQREMQVTTMKMAAKMFGGSGAK